MYKCMSVKTKWIGRDQAFRWPEAGQSYFVAGPAAGQP